MITPKQIQKGMMGSKFDNNFNGMLFLMEGNEHCFWMKNCIIPLDIIFIKDFKIKKIHHNCPPCKEGECRRYCGNGEIILEIKGGSCKKFDIKVGDVIDIL